MKPNPAHNAPSFGAEDLRRALACLVVEGEPSQFAVAVSGGSDSLALLVLAAEAFPTRAHALTVDHGIRPESAEEAQRVAAWCQNVSIPHTLLTLPQPLPAGNLQAVARSQRYHVLGAWCAAHGWPFLLTAHTQDDVAETFLLRLARGSGVTGLSQMAARRSLEEGTTLLRPLLQVSRAALQEVLRARGHDWISDPSNQDMRFDRAKARAFFQASPLMGLTTERLANTAAILSRVDEALEWSARRLFNELVQIKEADKGIDVVFPDRLGLLDIPQDLARRLILLALSHLKSYDVPPRQADLDRLMKRFADTGWRGSSLAQAQFRPMGGGLRVSLY